MRLHAPLQCAESLFERLFPKRLPFIKVVAVHVVDKNVEAARLGLDSLEQRGNLLWDSVIDLYGNGSTAALSSHFCGVIDGLRAAPGRRISSNAASRAEH